jgi:N-acetylglucosaminyldiphosphoundecaprenol N-acetyl-beta-D-mannosaminyltransferase
VNLSADSHPRKRIGDLVIDDVSFSWTVNRIITWAAAGRGAMVVTPNADYVVRARRDIAFRESIEAADLRVPDGMWIIYASRLAGRAVKSTVTGRLLVPAVASRAAGKGVRVGLFGAGPGVAPQAAARLRAEYPTLNVVAAVTPPMGFRVGSAEDEILLSELQSAKPQVLFVALGAPKQELWIARHREDLPDTVLIGVGAAFDILAGRFREAPRWMTKTGFEWVYRLWQEPRRLARRYLIDDPWILLWAAKTRLSKRGLGSPRSGPKQ